MDVTGSGFDNSWSADRLFAGPGETRERLRRTDWAATPLGPVETWSVELRAAVRDRAALRGPDVALVGS